MLIRLPFSLALGLAATANLAAAARTPLSGVKLGATTPNVLPNAYVVELDNVKSVHGSRREFTTPHQQIYRRLEERGVSYEVFA
jgi:hypothetical protein